MGDKIESKKLAKAAGVSTVPGHIGVITTAKEAVKIADKIGYPVMIKASAGGGGKGMRMAHSANEVADGYATAMREARSSFGDDRVFIEKFVTSPRHIEIQVLADQDGQCIHLNERECSIQRRNQKIIEEAPSPFLDNTTREAMGAEAIRLAKAVGYYSAGTVEFIVDDARNFYFLEMNTRLQVEHPVTEWVSGVDIVAQQFRIAAGESIADLAVQNNGYAMEARINAERILKQGDGSLAFRPHPGKIDQCHFPEEEGVEIIAAVGPGKFISPYYDSMVAQIIVYAESRDAAAAKLADYLDRVKLTGICSNIPLLRKILVDEIFLAGVYDTNYLPELLLRSDIDALIESIERGSGTTDAEIDLDSLRIEASDELKVLAPATAIFYSAPSPSEPEYVSVGDEVSLDHTLCQLEAMKIFSPLCLGDFNADGELYDPTKRYQVTRINMSNGQQVNVGDLLFVVKPV